MQPREWAAALTAVLGDFLSNRAEPQALAERLRALADDLSPASQVQLRLVGTTDPPVPFPEATLTAQRAEREKLNAADVFAYWQRILGKPKALFTQERQSKVRARLREGYSVMMLCRAIDAVAASPFHRGENKGNREYVDLTLICQTGSKVEQFLEMGGAAPTAATPDSPVGELEELRRTASEQLRNGDPGYEKTQQKIRAMKARLG